MPRDIGWHDKYRHGFTVTGQASTGADAERDLEEATRKYEQSTWPGGMVTGRALIYWEDLGTWSGVFESYYSFS